MQAWRHGSCANERASGRVALRHITLEKSQCNWICLVSLHAPLGTRLKERGLYSRRCTHPPRDGRGWSLLSGQGLRGQLQDPKLAQRRTAWSAAAPASIPHTRPRVSDGDTAPFPLHPGALLFFFFLIQENQNFS